MQWQKLPLHEDWDYRYTVNLEGVLYNIRLYYSNRTSDWTMNIFTETGESVTGGVRVRSREPIRITAHKALTGIFWLEPKSVSVDNDNLHPSLINKYFNFYYGWGEVETPEVERVLVRNETSRVFHVTSSLYPLYFFDDLSTGRSFLKYSNLTPSFEDDLPVSRSIISIESRGTGYYDHHVDDKDYIQTTRTLLGYEISETRYLEARIPEQEISSSRSLISVVPKVVMINYYTNDDNVSVGRSILDITVESQ